MLAKLLATGIGLGSFTFYISAFFFPEVHRRHDFFWSGVGMFYALVLWICAGRFTGAVLLGQVASVALVGWLGWQTLRLRRAKTPLLLQTPATKSAWRGFRQEMQDLLRSILAATPLGRLFPAWVTQASEERTQSDGAGIRAAAIREVGYEFVDDIDIPEPLPRPPQNKPKAASAQQEPSPATAGTSQQLTGRKPSGQPSPAKPAGILTKAIILTNWVGDVAKSLTRPKPPRPVIDIPPRPAKQQSAQSDRTDRQSASDAGTQEISAPNPANQSAPEQEESNWSETESILPEEDIVEADATDNEVESQETRERDAAAPDTAPEPPLTETALEQDLAHEGGSEDAQENPEPRLD